MTIELLTMLIVPVLYCWMKELGARTQESAKPVAL
jgi:hypothetical protein